MTWHYVVVENPSECSRLFIFDDGANVRRSLDAESICVSGEPYSLAEISSHLYRDIFLTAYPGLQEVVRLWTMFSSHKLSTYGGEE